VHCGGEERSVIEAAKVNYRFEVKGCQRVMDAFKNLAAAMKEVEDSISATQVVVVDSESKSQ
jgi:hypothetical protein